MNKRSQIVLYSLGTIVFTFLLIFLVIFMASSTGGVGSFNPEDERPIGYKFLDDGKVVHIWNTQDDYFFDRNSGIQFTNHYEDYWSKNIFCIGYYSGEEWIKIKCADELSNFNRDIQTDNETYVNATLWKDITYEGYDMRLGINYYLGLNDKNLSITIYGKNIGDDIPFDLGFAWKVGNLDVPSSETTDKILINNTKYGLDGTYNLTFKNMTMKKTYINWNETCLEECEGESCNLCIINQTYSFVSIPFYKIYDKDSGNLLNKENFLRLNWNENLPYAVKMFGNGNQEDFYVALLINVGEFKSNDEKSTTFYWIDALIDGLVSYYKLDETSGNVVDSHGTNTGTNYGATRGVTGNLSNAFSFDGSNDYVSLGNDSSLGFDYNEAFSVSFWMKHTDQGNTVFVSKHEDEVNHNKKGWSIFNSAGKVYIQLNSGTSYGDNEIQVGTNDATFDDNAWHHVVVTYDGSADASGITIYVDDSSEAVTVNQNTLSASIINILNTTIGANSLPTNYINATIDCLGIWESELNSTHVNTLWNDGNCYEDFLVVETAPTSTLNNPTDNQNFTTSSVTFSITPTDPEDATGLGVNLYENWTSAWNLNSSNASAFNNTQTNFTIAGIPDGIWIWNAEVNDTGDLIDFGDANFTFIIDTTIPSISLPLYPNATLKKNTETLTLNVSVSDATIGLASNCFIDINGTNQTIAISSGWCNTTDGNLTGLSDGNKTIKVYVNDTLNNMGLNNSYVVWIDTTNPSVSYDATTDSSGYYNKDYILINISATDTNLDSVRLNWDGTNETFASNVGDNYWENKTSLSDGNITFYGSANDSAGNYDLTSTREVAVDTISPLIDFGTGVQSNNSNVSADYIFVNVSYSESNPQNITFRIYNSSGNWNTTTYLTTSNTTNNSINFTSLADGKYYVNATLYDKALNSNTTSLRWITLDATDPITNFYSPANATTSSSVSQTFMFNFTDNNNLKNSTFYIWNSTGSKIIGNAWDISTAIYDNINISTQDIFAKGLFFKSDGTKLYEIGAGDNKFYQYTCSDAWNLSSCTYDSVTISTQEFSPTDLFFKSDGTKLYEIDNIDDLIHQYTCSDAWNLSSCTYDNVNISTQSPVPSGMFFKSDGTKLYEASGFVRHLFYQYSCTDAWNLSSCTYDSVTISTQDPYPEDLFFKSDGTKLYEVGIDGQKIYQYTCSDAWDLSSCTYDNINLSVQAIIPADIFFKPDGTKLYLIDTVYQSKIWQYSLFTTKSISGTSDSTSWDYNFTSEGIYYWNTETCDQVGNCAFNSTNRTITIDTTLPILVLSRPQSSTEKTYNSGTNLPLNFTITEINQDSCWFKVVAENGTTVINNNSITSCANTTFNLFYSAYYTLTLFANDSAGNENSTSVNFLLSLEAPDITLNAPTNNSYTNSESLQFKFTAIDFDGISQCKLYENWTSAWNDNETFSFVTSGVAKNSSSKNIGEGKHIWNVWCEDTLDTGNFSLNNYTINIDRTASNVTISNLNNSQVLGQAFTLNYNITDDKNLSSCYFTLKDSDGNPNNYGANATLNCSETSRSLTALTVGTFVLNTWGEDSAGNLNVTEIYIQTTAFSKGGKTGVPTIGLDKAVNFSITTFNYKDRMDITIAVDTTKPRKKQFYLINEGLDSIKVKVGCNTEEVNQSSYSSKKKVDICEYVKFPIETFDVPPNVQNPAIGTVLIDSPNNTDYGDKYFFNIVAVSEGISQYDRLSTKAQASVLGIFYKWNFAPFQKDTLDSEKTSYPVFLASFLMAFILSLVTLAIFMKYKMTITGIFSSLIVFVISIIVSLILL